MSTLKQNTVKVGIEAIALDLPEYCLNLEDLAHARGIDPGKFTIGLGQKQMSVASPCEDTVVLAAGAGERLLKSFDVDPKSVGLLVVGTETGIDHSKPVASYVHEMLGLDQACRVYETKHACYGGMAGLSNAVNWVLSGRAKGRKALVIASDIAYYGLRTPGEPTQGAGAVALLVSDQPDLLQIETDTEGYYAKQVMDFWRPLYSKEAFADGHYSIQCYLDALRGAFGTYKKNCSWNGKYSDELSALLYHAPFVKMAQKAHLRLLETDFDQTFVKDSPEFQLATLDYQNKVAPWLELNSRVGNIYTGSVFLSLLGFLQDGGTLNVGKSVGLFSYGSGCAAEFMVGTVGEKIDRLQNLIPARQLLAERKNLSIPEYETMMTAYAKADLNGGEANNPAQWGLTRPLVYLGTREHQRRYSVSLTN